jgi:hypothetical protein
MVEFFEVCVVYSVEDREEMRVSYCKRGREIEGESRLK